jgi:hypothetical protein
LGDDTILLLNSYEENARYLKLSLAYLEELPWMKINYDKSDLMIIGLDDSLVNDLAGPFLSKKGGNFLSNL